MKKNIILYLFTASTMLFGVSQANGQVKYGPIVGFNMTTLDNFDLGLGASLGFFGQIELYDRFGWRPEVIFNTRAGSNTVAGPPEITTDYNISSVDISVLSFYIPFSTNLNAHLGMRSTSWNTGTASSNAAGSVDQDLDSFDSSGLFNGFYVGLMYETVGGLTFEGRFTSMPAGDELSGAAPVTISGEYTEIMFNLSYKLDW